MRIVIDTNILVSAAFFGGLPEQLIDLVLDKKISAVVSREIVDEYEKTIKKLLDKYNLSRLRFPFSSLIASLEFIVPSTQVNLCADPDDDKFISCAIDGLCPFIVSGDHHLLEVKRYGKIQIIKTRAFFENWYSYIL
jgi:putative PIN family toxin of toxin-antitoxin system